MSYTNRIIVEETVTKKTYKKVRCNCHNVRDGKCDKDTSCDHFMTSMTENDLIDIINNSNLEDGNRVNDIVYHFNIVDKTRGNWEYVWIVS